MIENLILITLMHENTPHFLISLFFFFFETFRGAFAPSALSMVLPLPGVLEFGLKDLRTLTHYRGKFSENWYPYLWIF